MPIKLRKNKMCVCLWMYFLSYVCMWIIHYRKVEKTDHKQKQVHARSVSI